MSEERLTWLVDPAAERVAIVDFTSPAGEHRAVNSVDLIVSSVLPSLHVRASQLFA